MALRWDKLAKTDEVFSWHNQTSDEVIHIAATRLNAYLAGTGWPLVKVVIDPALAKAVASQNGIEPDHVFRISPERLEEPVTLLDLEDGTTICCDGSHRIVRRFIDQIFWVQAFMCPVRLWRRFTIEGTPGHAAQWRAWLESEQTLRKP